MNRINKNTIRFDNVVDPFSMGTRISCDLCTEAGVDYGAITITDVDNVLMDPQTINGTPKLYYPFNQSRRYKFPSATEIRSYEKYDGTNITMYRYKDSDGWNHITYKVRLYPFLRGQFVGMWKRILSMYPDIPKLFQMNPDMTAFSFELFGSDNLHLIQYKEKLDTRLLFALKGTEVCIPEEVHTGGVVPHATFNFSIDKDYIWYYEQEQQAKDKELKTVKRDDDKIAFEGSEGSIWYLKEKDTGKWRMYKCKPHQIEKIHWAHEHIPKATCYMTAMNVLETDDNVTYDAVEKLLLEEFTVEKVDGSHRRIAAAVDEVQGEVEFNREVDRVVSESGFDNETDLTTIMRGINKHFPRNMMKKVFTRVKTVRERENVGI